ncbi:hypothetical protein K2Z84_05200 [Candidatus Binatia bacterium]|nr:hypothetical protein [Candidatus Binatia bacterium]
MEILPPALDRSGVDMGAVSFERLFGDIGRGVDAALRPPAAKQHDFAKIAATLKRCRKCGAVRFAADTAQDACTEGR